MALPKTVLFPTSAGAAPPISSSSTTYIVGGGVAGLLTAQALLMDPERSGADGGRSPIVIVEQSEQLGMGLTRGNGRSLTATEGLVAAGMAPSELEQALVTPLEKGGYAYPGFVPTQADRQQMQAYAAGLRAIASDIPHRDLALVRYGLATLTQWQCWADTYPDLATASGFYLSEKLRIYGGARAQERAIAEVNRLNQAGEDCGWSLPGRLVNYRDAVAFDPAMAGYLDARLTPDQTFDGALTLQPGGAIHVGRLVEQLTQTLVATGRLTVQTRTQVQSIQWRSPAEGRNRSIAGLIIHQGGNQITLGTANDHYIFATGFDGLLHQSGAIPAPLFPVAGTSITLVLPPTSAPGAGHAFPKRAWKQDTLGPLVFSPTFDTVLQRWILRIGGFKFYPGTTGSPPLDLDHPGVQWSITQQLQQAIAFMPDTMAQVLGPDAMRPPLDWHHLTATVNPWVGLRPLYADGMAALGPFARNGYAISGTGSWGLSSGIGNAALMGQWLKGIPTEKLTLAGIPTPWLQDYLQRVNPLRFHSLGTPAPPI